MEPGSSKGNIVVPFKKRRLFRQPNFTEEDTRNLETLRAEAKIKEEEVKELEDKPTQPTYGDLERERDELTAQQAKLDDTILKINGALREGRIDEVVHEERIGQAHRLKTQIRLELQDKLENLLGFTSARLKCEENGGQ